MQRDPAEASDIFSSLLAAMGWSLSALPFFDPGDAGGLFRVAGVVAGAVTVFPALLLIFLEPRRGPADRRLLMLGAVVLASIGLSHVGWAEPWQVAFGYLVPALLTAASVALMVSDLRLRVTVPDRQTS